MGIQTTITSHAEWLAAEEIDEQTPTRCLCGLSTHTPAVDMDGSGHRCWHTPAQCGRFESGFLPKIARRFHGWESLLRNFPVRKS